MRKPDPPTFADGGAGVLSGAAAPLPPGSRPADLLASLVAAAVGAPVLAAGSRVLSPGDRRGPADEVASGGATAPSRRGIVLGSGALLALSALAGAGGQWVVRARTRLALPECAASS